MYLAVYLEDRGELAKFEAIGSWFNYFVYDISEDLVPRLDLLNHRPIVIPSKDIAYAWKFAGVTRGLIKPRKTVNEIRAQLVEVGASFEPYSELKDLYRITEEDEANALTFMRLILTDMVHRGFERQWYLEKPQISKHYLEVPIDTLPSEVGKRVEEYRFKLADLVARMYAREQTVTAAASIAEANEVLYQLTVELNPAGND